MGRVEISCPSPYTEVDMEMRHTDFYVGDTPPPVAKPVGAQIIGYWYNTTTRKLMEMQAGIEDWVEVANLEWVTQEQLDALSSLYAAINHTHDGLDQLPDIITLLSNGITGSKIIGGYKFTFNHGVLVGFEPV